MRRLLCTALLLTAAAVWAEDPAPAQAKAPAKKRKVIRLEALTVEGRIQKPQAFYILQRSNLSFGELNRAESFLPKVEKALDQEPF